MPIRVLFAGYSLAEPSGGGELSARALLRGLARRHDVEALCIGKVAREYTIGDGVRCRDFATRLLPAPAGFPFHLAAMLAESHFRSQLVRRLQMNAPDLLILQQPAYLHPRDLPANTKVIVFMRSLVCYGAGDANPTAWKRAVSHPFRAARFRKNRALLDRSDLIVSNSRFLQRALSERAGIASHVVTPFIDTDALHAASPAGARGCVTFVGLDEWKGASIALHLAEALPHRRFLFLDGPRASADMRAHASRLQNVTRVDWTDDMGRIFDRTRVLLMPSLWEEPFGRLPVEAGACGIPTLASARGGLPESVGAGGILIDPPEDLAQWIRRLDELDDAGRYASLSAAARQHAASLGLEITLKRFGGLVHRELGIDLQISP